MSKGKKTGSLTRQQIKDKIERNELDLSLCELTDVPVKDMVIFPKITILDLSCNKLSELPEQFGDLRQLVRLDLSKNSLVCLPQSFGRLDSLKNLDLYSNQLSSLPLSFAQLSDLKWLDVKNNPLDDDLAKVAGTCTAAEDCQKCARNVLAFMRAAAAQAEREYQDRLDRQREAELRQRKIDAERAAELRKQKQIEKQQRREKYEQQRREQEEKERAAQSETDRENNGSTPDRSSSGLQQTSEAEEKFPWCFFLAILLLITLAAACAFFYGFCSQGPEICSKWKQQIQGQISKLLT